MVTVKRMDVQVGKLPPSKRFGPTGKRRVKFIRRTLKIAVRAAMRQAGKTKRATAKTGRKNKPTGVSRLSRRETGVRQKGKKATTVKGSTTKLTTDELKAKGWFAEKVEYWNNYARRRMDLFNCIDIVAVSPKLGQTLGVQATSRTNVSARVAKIGLLPAAKAWLRVGNRLEVWGWDKYGGRTRALVVELGVNLAGKVFEKGRYELGS